jgi:uncharacterized membrane-anchored protein
MKTTLPFLSMLSSLPFLQKLRGVRLALFALFAAATLAVPLGMIARYENIHANGVVHKFRAAPIDPQDPFRGHFIRLGFADRKVTISKEFADDFYYAHRPFAYVRLKKDAAGFSVPVEFSWEPFSGDGTDYITVDKSYRNYNKEGTDTNEVTLYYPFSSYYLPEQIAPEAEKAYFSRTRNAAARADTYVTVRVLGGKAVLEELYINNIPVRQAVRDARSEQNKK